MNSLLIENKSCQIPLPQQRKLNQVTNVTKDMSFVGIFFCMTIIVIALISSPSNSPIMNNNYYYAHAATVD